MTSAEVFTRQAAYKHIVPQTTARQAARQDGVVQTLRFACLKLMSF